MNCWHIFLRGGMCHFSRLYPCCQFLKFFIAISLRLWNAEILKFHAWRAWRVAWARYMMMTESHSSAVVAMSLSYQVAALMIFILFSAFYHRCNPIQSSNNYISFIPCELFLSSVEQKDAVASMKATKKNAIVYFNIIRRRYCYYWRSCRSRLRQCRQRPIT